MKRLSYRIIGNDLSSTKGWIAGSSERNSSLRTREILSATGDLQGVVAACHSGLIWVTQKGDFRDHMLTAGERMTISNKGMVLIQALTDVSFSVAAPDRLALALSNPVCANSVQTAGDTKTLKPCIGYTHAFSFFRRSSKSGTRLSKSLQNPGPWRFILKWHNSWRIT